MFPALWRTWSLLYGLYSGSHSPLNSCLWPASTVLPLSPSLFPYLLIASPCAFLSSPSVFSAQPGLHLLSYLVSSPWVLIYFCPLLVSLSPSVHSPSPCLLVSLHLLYYCPLLVSLPVSSFCSLPTSFCPLSTSPYSLIQTASSCWVWTWYSSI